MHQDLGTEKLSNLYMKFVIPAVISMVLSGMQSMVDGVFLGRFASTNSMASVNIAIPFMQIILGCTMIISSGSISFLGRTLGERSQTSMTKAQNIMRSSVSTLFFVTVFIMMAGVLFSNQFAEVFGANSALLEETSDYIRVLAVFSPFMGFMILLGFTARLLGKPHLYLIASVLCLACNILMDFIAIELLGLGAAGAALATGFSYLAGLCVTIRPFLKKDSLLKLFGGVLDIKLINHTIYNGSSEGVTSLSAAVTIWLFNSALMQYSGEDGVAAFAVINYIGNFVILVMFGVSDGIGSLVSYNYGAGLMSRVKKILRVSLVLNFVIGILIFGVFNLYSRELIEIFITNNESIVDMAVKGSHLYSIAFLFNGFNIIQSGFHTSLGNSFNSILIAGSRGVIFVTLGMFLLPIMLGINGVWLTILFAEICTLIVYFFINKKSQYQYAKA